MSWMSALAIVRSAHRYRLPSNGLIGGSWWGDSLQNIELGTSKYDHHIVVALVGALEFAQS